MVSEAWEVCHGSLFYSRYVKGLFPSQDSNLKPPEPKSGALPVELDGITRRSLMFKHAFESHVLQSRANPASVRMLIFSDASNAGLKSPDSSRPPVTAFSIMLMWVDTHRLIAR